MSTTFLMSARDVEGATRVSTRPTTPPRPETPRAAPSWKAVVLPAEHGGWGMLAEPVLVALVAAPSPAAAAVSVAALAVFLARQPLKLWLTDRERGAAYARTRLAARAVVACALLALGAAAAAAHAMPGRAWIPLVMAVPLALVQLHYDVRRQGRHLLPELAGSATLGAVAAMALLGAGHGFAVALAAWVLLAGKNAAAVLYVRARFRLERARDAGGVRPAVLSHVALALAAAAGALAAGAPPAAVGLAVLLWARAAWGLSPWHRVVRPQRVGWAEMAWGVLWALTLAAGYRAS